MTYPSDLTDKQWAIVQKLLPKRRQSGFKRKYSERSLINAIFYVLKTGCQWRYLPKDYPPWQSAHRYFTKLHNERVFESINAAFVKKVRIQDGRNLSPSLMCIDSQSIKADANVDCRGIDGNKKINGRKRHFVLYSY